MARCLLSLLFSSLLSGCAVTHINSDGSTSIYGFVFTKIHPPTQTGETVATSVDVKSIGLGLHLTPQQSSMTIGYGHVAGIIVQDGVVIAIDPNGSITAVNETEFQVSEVDLP